MYRAAENTLRDKNKRSVINLLFWPNKVYETEDRNIVSKCCIAPLANIIDWSAVEPDRFYFKEQYDNKGKAHDLINLEQQLPCAAL